MKELLLVAIFLASTFVARADDKPSKNKLDLLDQNAKLIEEVQKLKEELEAENTSAACKRTSDLYKSFDKYIMDAGMKMETKDHKDERDYVIYKGVKVHFDDLKVIKKDKKDLSYKLFMDNPTHKHKKVIKLAIEDIAYLQRIKSVCSVGEKNEIAEAFFAQEDMSEGLDDIVSSLKRQKRKIKRDDVNESSSFIYEYNNKSTQVILQ